MRQSAEDVVSEVGGTGSGTQPRSLALVLALVLRAVESQKGADPT